MTVKLIVLYGHPDDCGAFDEHYVSGHAPLVDKIAGLQSWDVVKFVAALDGAELPYYQMAELRFADQAALDAAFASPEGQAAAADYGQIAPPGSRMFVAASVD